ncbi:MAG: O-antigen ligase domain-containing protein [Bacteroidetes bacterium]|nr:O-antigen ligase domain-containing protein [Bacteroidota bacterium]
METPVQHIGFLARNRHLFPAILSGLALSLVISWLIGQAGFPVALIYGIFAPLLVFVYATLIAPRVGIVGYLLASYFAIGINRYIPGPLGLSIDALLALTWLGVLFSTTKEDRKRMNNPLSWIMLIWFGYTFLELVNPEVHNRAAWFFAVRGLSVYFVLAVPLVFILSNKRRDLIWFVRAYLVLTLIVALWGFKQKYFGVDSAERAWLDAGAASTHILFGRLRVFSFLSDAGQFGALMAHAVIISLVIGLGERLLWKKILYVVLSGFFFIALAISGSRGPVIIVFAGLGMYLVLIQNFRLLVFGGIMALSIFVFLKYTSVGSGIYEIQRLRTALDPNDASFQVRLENQKLLRSYLASRPMGGGIGSGGSWGQRFTPGSFLAEVPYDSWYVKVWVETGVIGLLLYIILIIVILIYGYFYLKKSPDQEVRLRCLALYAGYFGICVGSYGNQIYGQSPISTIIVFSLCFIFMAPKLIQTDESEPESLHHHRQLQGE